MTIPTTIDPENPLAKDELVVHEIGSLAKPEWRVKPKRGDPVTDADVQDAKDWADKLSLTEQAQPLFDLFSEKRDGFTDAERELITSQASLFAIRLQEQAGMDWVYDGEQHRSEMYRYPVTHSEGFEFRGYCRSFDNKYWNKAAVVDRPTIEDPFHAHEFDTIAGHADAPVKVPITGAYTLVDWSFDEHYLRKHLEAEDIEPGTPERAEARAKARREFAIDVARRIVRPNIQDLVDRGAKWIQIDEPAVTTHPDEVDIYVEAFNEAVKGFDDVRFATHICFSDYNDLFPEVLELENCAEFSLELANRDPDETGTDRETRTGYHMLDAFAEHDVDQAIGLGVVDIHTDEIEDVQVVADRIRYALDVFDGDPSKIWPCTDCGLRTRDWEVSFKKMQRVAEGTQRAKKQLGLD